MEDFKYSAFISYSHQDERFVAWLHRWIEKFKLPKRYQQGKGVPVKRLRPIFRDKDELPCSSDLSHEIRDALKQSRFLIVVCSPNSAGSKWVNEEVRAFKELRKDGEIFSLIISGVPGGSRSTGEFEDRECFPNALLEESEPSLNKEPIAADCRKRLPNGERGPSKEHAAMKLISGMLKISFDGLYDRHKRRQARALAIWGVSSTLVLLLFTVVSFYAAAKRSSAIKSGRELTDTLDFIVGDFQESLARAGRLDLLSAPLEKVDYYLQRNPDTDLTVSSKLACRKANIQFLRGDKLSAIATLESTRDRIRSDLDGFSDFWVKAISWALNAFGREDSRYREMVESLARVERQLGDYYGWLPGYREEAVNSCKRAVALYEKLLVDDLENFELRYGLAESKSFLADIRVNERRADIALRLYRETEDCLRDWEIAPVGVFENERVNNLVIRARIRSSGILNSDRLYPDAIAVLKPTKETISKRLKLESRDLVAVEQMSEVLKGLSWAYGGNRNMEESADALIEAISNQEFLVDVEPQNQNFRRNLAYLYLKLGTNQVFETSRREESIARAFEQIGAITENGRRSSDIYKLLSRAHRVKADFAYFLGDFDSAMVNYEKVIELCLAWSEEGGSSEVFSKRVAKPLDAGESIGERVAGARIGFARSLSEASKQNKSLSEEVDGILHELDSALSAYEEFFGRDGSSIWLRDKAVVFDARGEVLQAVGDLGGAGEAYDDGLELRKRLLADEVGISRTALLADLAINYQKRAQVDRTLELYKDADLYYSRAVEVQGELTSLYPSDVEFRSTFVKLLLSQAGNLQDSGDLDSAERVYLQAESKLLESQSTGSQNTSYFRDLSLLRYRLGKLYFSKELLGKCTLSYNQSWESYMELVDFVPISGREVHIGPLKAIARRRVESSLVAEISGGWQESQVQLCEVLGKFLKDDPKNIRIALSLAESLTRLEELEKENARLSSRENDIVDELAILAVSVIESEGSKNSEQVKILKEMKSREPK